MTPHRARSDLLSPKHNTASSPVTTQVCLYPEEMLVIEYSSGTVMARVGLERAVFVPSPNWQSLLYPCKYNRNRKRVNRPRNTGNASSRFIEADHERPKARTQQ